MTIGIRRLSWIGSELSLLPRYNHIYAECCAEEVAIVRLGGRYEWMSLALDFGSLNRLLQRMEVQYVDIAGLLKSRFT
ncbi:MAG: hypothetical protein NTZ78_01325 [Candidatus Aureabacteria bacterium]|nr:hypothetical protein [Candidatus Auribacterota bacterium]